MSPRLLPKIIHRPAKGPTTAAAAVAAPAAVLGAVAAGVPAAAPALPPLAAGPTFGLMMAGRNPTVGRPVRDAPCGVRARRRARGAGVARLRAGIRGRRPVPYTAKK